MESYAAVKSQKDGLNGGGVGDIAKIAALIETKKYNSISTCISTSISSSVSSSISSFISSSISSSISTSTCISSCSSSSCFSSSLSACSQNYHYIKEENNYIPSIAEDLKGFVSVLMELQAYEKDLVALFKAPPDADSVDHHVLVQFRGKVARSITRYSLLVKKCWTLSEMLPHGSIRDEAKNEYQKHMTKLQECKNRLSIWWSKTERRFHMMRMSSLVSEVEMKRNAT